MMLHRSKTLLYCVQREFGFHSHFIASILFALVNSSDETMKKVSCTPHWKYLQQLIQTISKVIHNGKGHRTMWCAIALIICMHYVIDAIWWLFTCMRGGARAHFSLLTNSRHLISLSRENGVWSSETCIRHHRYGVRLLKINARAKTIVITFICLPDISPNKKSFLSIFKRH